jgi:flagellar hook-associated protein 1
MSGLSNALNVGKSSLLAGQKAIEVTGNNISNVNTPGYSRQVPVFSGFPSLNMQGFAVGSGSQVAQVDREHDAFLTRQIQEQSAGLGNAEAKTTPLAELERIVDISETSIASKIDDFFGSWQDLSTDPSSQVGRDTVIVNGEHLSQAFVQTVDELNALRQNLDINLTSQVEDLNSKFDEIVSLNKRITSIEMTGQTALADRDRRDILVQEVSTALGTRSVESAETGMVSLFLPNGISVVQDASSLTLGYENSGDTLNVYMQMGSQQVSLGSGNVGGSFSGLMEVRDELIPGIIEDLDKLAYGLSTEVNKMHQWGTGLDGISSRAFFTPPEQSTGAAASLAVAISDYRQVAAGRSDATGDNSNALDLAALSEAKSINGNETFVAFYSSLASRVGMESRQNQLALSGSQDSFEQLNNLRDAKVGVSLEEEMINLIKYQRSFEASAKFVATIDELMDTVLSLKR